MTIETANAEFDEEYAHSHLPFARAIRDDRGQRYRNRDDPETQKQIFEPFFTTKEIDQPRTWPGPVYGIVKQSDGFIWVYSEKGVGSAFKVYFPRIPKQTNCLWRNSKSLNTWKGRKQFWWLGRETALRTLIRETLGGVWIHGAGGQSPEKKPPMSCRYETPFTS